MRVRTVSRRQRALKAASQDVSDAGRVPGATTGSCDPLSIQPISAISRNDIAPGSLNLLDPGDHLNRAGIGGLPVPDWLVRGRLGGPVLKRPCAPLPRRARRVFGFQSVRSFSANAANRCSTNGSTSAPSSATRNGTRCTISPLMKCTSRLRRSSLATPR